MTGWLKYRHADDWHRVDVKLVPGFGYEARMDGRRVLFGPRDVLVVVGVG